MSAACPREHGKSTAITFALALYMITWKLARHVLLIGSNEKMASQFLIDIAVEMEENEELAKEYGFKKFIKNTESELIFLFKDGTKSRIIAKGAGQRMRGLKWERKRPDLILFDDMEDDEMVLNEATKEKFQDWFLSAVIPIGGKDAKIRGVGTIIGWGSFLEKTMPDSKKKTTIVEPLRTYSLDRDGWVSVKYKAHPRINDFSTLLWPENFSEQWFKTKRAVFEAEGKLDKYAQEFLNDPIDLSKAYFRKADLLAMTEDDLKKRDRALTGSKEMTFYASGDLAIGEKERNAFTVFIVGGLDSDGFLHIVDVRRERMDGEEIVGEMFSVQDRWGPDTFKLESENIAKSIGPFLDREMEERGVWINIDDEAPTKDKDKRARSIQGRLRRGKVKFDKDADWYPDLEEELLRYPRTDFKDQVDALAWLGLMLDDMVNPLKDEEIEEEEYQEQIFQHIPKGICEATGY